MDRNYDLLLDVLKSLKSAEHYLNLENRTPEDMGTAQFKISKAQSYLEVYLELRAG